MFTWSALPLPMSPKNANPLKSMLRETSWLKDKTKNIRHIYILKNKNILSKKVIQNTAQIKECEVKRLPQP